METGSWQTLAAGDLFRLLASIKPLRPDHMGSIPAQSAAFDRVTPTFNYKNRQRCVVFIYYLIIYQRRLK